MTCSMDKHDNSATRKILSDFQKWKDNRSGGKVQHSVTTYFMPSLTDHALLINQSRGAVLASKTSQVVFLF